MMEPSVIGIAGRVARGAASFQWIQSTASRFRSLQMFADEIKRFSPLVRARRAAHAESRASRGRADCGRQPRDVVRQAESSRSRCPQRRLPRNEPSTGRHVERARQCAWRNWRRAGASRSATALAEKMASSRSCSGNFRFEAQRPWLDLLSARPGRE